MAPKAPEKSPQQQQQQQTTIAAEEVTPVKQHSSPFYISAHYLCHNKRLKQKRSKYAEFISKARSAAAASASRDLNNKKTELRRQMLSHLTAEVTIDLLSDDDDDNVNKISQKNGATKYRGQMCLERAALLGLMPVEKLKQKEPPPLIPIVNNNNNNNKSRNSIGKQPKPQIYMQKEQQQLQQQQQQQLQLVLVQKQMQQQPRKRKSRPQKRKSLPAPVLLNNESIVLSDDSEEEQQPPQPPYIPFISPSITVAPDLTVVYPSSQQIPCPSTVPPFNTMQVDEEVTISLVPRSQQTGVTNSSHARSSFSVHNDEQIASGLNSATQQSPPPFPMLPDETTVHTVIANRIYELSLTKLREGLASCGIPEFNGATEGQQKKISPPRRKGTVKPPPEMITPPQAPISLKLSSDLSISLISDDEEDTTRHHQNHNESLLSPAFLQKLPVNVSIAPVNLTSTPRTATIAVDPRKLKFG